MIFTKNQLNYFAIHAYNYFHANFYHTFVGLKRQISWLLQLNESKKHIWSKQISSFKVEWVHKKYPNKLH